MERAALIRVGGLRRRPRPDPGDDSVPVHRHRHLRLHPSRARRRSSRCGRGALRRRPSTAARSTRVGAGATAGCRCPGWPRRTSSWSTRRWRTRTPAQGLHRFVDPADGQVYVYAASFLDEAPGVFACFDQPDLKAPFTVTVDRRPGSGRSPATARRPRIAPGRWELATTPAAGDLLRDRDRRAVPRGPRRARRHPARALRPRARSPPHLDTRRREIFAITRSLPGPVPRAVRRAVPVRQVRPGVRARVHAWARWRTRAASRSATSTSSPRRSPRPSARSGRSSSRTRWRTCGSATWSPCAGGTTCG